MSLHAAFALAAPPGALKLSKASNSRRARVLVRASDDDNDKERRIGIGSQGGGFSEDLLDFALAGPKMRRWYGQEDALPSELIGDKKGKDDDDGGGEFGEEGNGGDKVLVLDADGGMGQAVLTALVLARAEIRAVARNTQPVRDQFGPYAEVISGDMKNPAFAKRVLRGVRAVIAAGSLGAVPDVAASAGVSQIILISAVPSGGGFLGLFGGNEIAASIAQPGDAREAQLASCGVPCTTLRAGPVQDAPGMSQVTISAGNGAGSAAVSADDLAAVAAAVAGMKPKQAGVLELAVSGGGGAPAPQLEQFFAPVEAATTS
ncbi:unnamed protein product [Pedinophyceae sp. YPF-701]|nr:unnamed protein product [Pedinophyceae sp. YPF-701]